MPRIEIDTDDLAAVERLARIVDRHAGDAVESMPMIDLVAVLLEFGGYDSPPWTIERRFHLA